MDFRIKYFFNEVWCSRCTVLFLYRNILVQKQMISLRFSIRPIHFHQFRIIIKIFLKIYNAILFYKTQQQQISKSKNHLKKNLKHSTTSIIFGYTFGLLDKSQKLEISHAANIPELSSRYRTQDTSIAPCGINERPIISMLGLCTDLPPLTVTAGEPWQTHCQVMVDTM